MPKGGCSGIPLFLTVPLETPSPRRSVHIRGVVRFKAIWLDDSRGPTSYYESRLKGFGTDELHGASLIGTETAFRVEQRTV